MGMTIIERIFARKAGLDSVSPGDTVVVDVDMTVLIDLQFATMWIQPNRIHDPDKLAVVMDHAVPAPTIRYQLDGVKPNTVSGKDIFLHIANEYGDAANLNLEFGGPGLAGIPMHDRRTIATQGAEISADFSTFEADDVLTNFLGDTGVAGYTSAAPDPDASYHDVRHIDLATLEPYVARPGTVSRNGLPVSQLGTQKVDQAFIGSCANGQLEDLEIAARVLRGKTVAPGVRLLITPASQAVYREAMRLGYLQDLADAGAVITNSTCGACFGYHMGVIGPGEVCITSSTRNFTGRMGSSEAEIFMASPATVAASAITGYITDPRNMTDHRSVTT